MRRRSSAHPFCPDHSGRGVRKGQRVCRIDNRETGGCVCRRKKSRILHSLLKSNHYANSKSEPDGDGESGGLSLQAPAKKERTSTVLLEWENHEKDSPRQTRQRLAPARSPASNCLVLVERGEDGYYVVECPVLPGCYTQGKTLDEALRNIREVIELLLEEDQARELMESYQPTEMGLHTLTL